MVQMTTQVPDELAEHIQPINVLIVFLSLLIVFWNEDGHALAPGVAMTQYLQTVWDSEDGLPQNSITAIVQTPDGYLWLGTYDGLVRWDGVTFTVFNERNSALKGNRILSLALGRAEDLWVGTEGGGLTHHTDGVFTTYTTKEGLPNNVVHALYEDAEGRVWMVTDARGVTCFDQGRFVTYTTKDGLVDNNVHRITGGSRGVWVGTSGGVCRWRDGRFTTHIMQQRLLNNDIRAMYEDRDGNLWIGTGRGVIAFRDGRITTYTEREGLLGQSVWALCEDRDGNLWIGTDDGLNRLTDGVLTVYPSRRSSRIRSLWEDREGNLWGGTDGEGLVRLKESPVTVYTTQEGLSHDGVLAVLEDRLGSLWVGTNCGGLNRLQRGRITVYTEREGLSNNCVWSLCEDRHGDLWIGTWGGGLNRLRDGVVTTYTTREGLLNDTVLALYEDRSGTLWIGTTGGLQSWREERFTAAYTTREGLSHNDVRVIYEDRAGTLWIGTAGGGLNRLRDGQFTAYTTTEGLSHNYVRAIYEDADGVLWVGTYGGGLNRLKDEKITAYRKEDGLFDDGVFQIFEDDRGNLWMGCNRGIFWVRKRELHEFAAGKIRKVTSVAYGVTDGLRSSECNGGFQPAGWKRRDGTLVFPTVKGVVVVNPRQERFNMLLPPVVVEDVVINGVPVDPQEHVEVPPGLENLEFHYTALSFVAPEKVRFRYTLEGFDRTWVEAGTRRAAYYTNLSPGDYRFRVIACNNDGIWNETGASFVFHLRPHFYQTSVFYVLCVMGIVVMGVEAYRFRIEQMMARERRLARLVAERTQALQQEVSERKRAEEAIQQAKETLEQRVQERTQDLQDSHKQLRTLSAHLQQVREEERTLIAREIHDELGGALTGMLLHLTRLERRIMEGADTALSSLLMQRVEEIKTLIDTTIQTVRRIATKLRPTILDHLGLLAAIEWQAQDFQERTDIRCLVTTHVNTLSLNDDVATAVFRIFQESLTNVARHSRATQVEVTVSEEGETLCLQVQDNGRGISDDEVTDRRSLGLLGMRERAFLLGGEVTIVGIPGKGTTVAIRIPQSSHDAPPSPDESMLHI